MWVFTSIADRFDQQKDRANKKLDEAVEDSGYSQGMMIVAAGTHAVMEFGSSFVDLLRLGDGVKEGGWGYGQDALRAVAIFPMGKVAQMLKSVKGLQVAKIIEDALPGEAICGWIAGSKALAHAGYKHGGKAVTFGGKVVWTHGGKVLIEVRHVAEAMGLAPSMIDTISLPAMVMYLKRLGANVDPIKIVTSINQVEQMVPRDGSVALLSLAPPPPKKPRPITSSRAKPTCSTSKISHPTCRACASFSACSSNAPA